MTTRLIAIGECMVEMAPQADGNYSIGFAGDTFNTAWYCQRLSGPELEVVYLSAVGDDELSARMTGFIKNSGIIPQLAVRIGKTVGLYMITLVDGERSFSYWRDTSAARTLVADLTNLPGIKAGDIAYFSGITLAILSDEDRAKLLGILAAERKKGVKVAFDPNLRPKLWASTDEMRHWIMKAARVADLALPSFEDEATFFDDKDSQATAKRYQRAGVETIVVKDGANPVLIVSGSQRKNVQPGVVDIAVDSTAAGDSFNAAFLVAIESGSDLESGARKACAVAATVISARGALVDM